MFPSTQPKIICRSAVILLVLLALSLTTLSAQFLSLTNPIEGSSTPGYEFITSKLSADGNTFITSGYIPGGNFFSTGWVQVHQRSGNDWIQKGVQLVRGVSPGSSLIGYAVAISDDGNTIALSQRDWAVITFTWDGTAWIQKGARISWDVRSGIGSGIALSADGNTLVVSTTDATPRPVRAYEFIGENWEPIGDALITDQDFITSAHVSAISGNGESVIVGSGRSTVNDGARVMQRSNGGWEQKGQTLPGDMESFTFGSSVAMSEDGNTVAVSTNFSETDAECESGYVKVFTYQNDSWVQLGNTVFESPESDCSSSFFGSNIALSGDGSILAISSHGNDSNGRTDNGKVSVFRYHNGAWGDEVIHRGNVSDDALGIHMSLSRDGKVLAVNSKLGTDGQFAQVEFFLVGYPPENDEACAPVALPVNGIPQGPFSNIYAELDPLESIIQPHDNGLSNSLWFTFRAPATGTVTASTCGATDFDTELAIYRVVNCGDYSSYVLLGYNDDGEELCPMRIQSHLTVSDLTPGEQYFLVVDGFRSPNIDNTRGNFEITLEAVYPACDNPAIAFDGVDDFVDISPSKGNFGAGDFTFEMMVKTSQMITNPAHSHIPLASKREGCGCAENFWYLSIIEDGRVRMEIHPNDCGQGFPFTSQTIINDDNWHHVVFTREGDFYALYVDGNREDSRNFPRIDQFNNAASLQLGASGCSEAGFGSIFKGQMDEVRTWDYARSDEEINDFRNQELAGSEEGLTAYYNFNDGRPGDDNTGRIGSIDLTGSQSVARMIAFDRNGTNSNWVAGTTGIVQRDRDEDGLYDACNEPDDLPTATRFEELAGVHLGQNYPNPTAGEVSIPIKLGGQHDAAELRFTSVMGKKR